MDLLEIGSAKIGLKVEPQLSQENDSTLSLNPNSALQITIPNINQNGKSSYNVSGYMLSQFKAELEKLLSTQAPQVTSEDNNGNQLSFYPTQLNRNGKQTPGYNMSVYPQGNNVTQVSTSDIQNLFNLLNQLNIHAAEAILTNQFSMLKNNFAANEKFNTPGTAAQNHGVNSVINSNIIDNINNGNKNNNGDKNKNQTTKSPFNDNASPYDSNSGSTTNSKDNN